MVKPTGSPAYFPGADEWPRFNSFAESLHIGMDLMAARELLVLIVRDNGLHSALIARLSLAGESLLTLEGDPGDPLLDRVAPASKILIIDSESLGDALQSLLDSESWAHIIILADQIGQSSLGRVCMVDRREALAGVSRALDRLRLSR